MDIAISGSTGLIGTALTRTLRAAGHQVIRLVRPGGQESASTVRWDPVGGTIDTEALDGVDAVVHLAGAGIGDKRWTDARKRELVDSRVGPTRLLAEALAGLDHPPRVMVSASGIDYYGDRGDEILTEASSRGSGFLADLCRDWEAATGPAAEAGVRVATIRSGIVLTTEGGALARQLPIFRLGLGGRLGSGRQYQSWISIDDEVGAISWLLEHDVAGPVNLTAPEPVTNLEFTKALGRALGRPTALPIPSFGPKLLYGSELVEVLLYESKRVVPAVLQAEGFAFRHPTLDEALAAVLGARST